MTDFLLDTNVVSELRKASSGRADPRVLAWVAAVPAERMHLSAISLLEIEQGVMSMERRDPRQGRVLREWLEHQVVPAFEGRFVPVDAHVARRCAALHVEEPRPERDALIAATALVHGMTVVTRDVAGFRPTGVPIVNPWA